MKSELVIDVQPSEVSIALLEDSRLVSLQKEARNIAYAVGDIYLAKVRKLLPGLNASFVNVGYEKDAFLHYLDLGPHFASYSEFMTKLLDDKKHIPQLSRQEILPDIDKQGKIADQLQSGREILVQIVKEPISTKGPRLTTELSFTGRYMVLTPFQDKVSVSQKIKSTEERMRLRQLLESIKPKNFGIIIRTSAEGKRVAELNNELKTLVKCWEDTLAKAQRATAPALVFEEESRIVGMLRDVFSPSFEALYVNDTETYEQIRNYVSLIAPERVDIVKLYTKPEPIFDTYAVTRQIKSSFGKTVSFKAGAYIIIEHTEALHTIDVNSGNRTKADTDQETNALDVNLRAADEIARQLRLRDMGGIIVVDFIDMAKGEHRQQLYEHMKEVMANDRARHNILPLSKFGLMQITRQRVRPVLDITTTETCPSCFGKGEIQPSLLFTDTLYEKLHYMVDDLGVKDFTLYVHPYVEAYLRKGWLTSLYRRWRRNLGVRFSLIPDQSLAYLQYRVVDKEGNAIDLKQEKDTQQSSVAKTRRRQDAARADAEDTAPEKTPKPKKAKAEKPAKVENNKDDKAVKTVKDDKTVKPEKAAKVEKNKSGKSDKPAKSDKPTKSATKEKKSGEVADEDLSAVKAASDKAAAQATSDKVADKVASAQAAPANGIESVAPSAEDAAISTDTPDAAAASSTKTKRNKHRRRSSRAKKSAAAKSEATESVASESSTVAATAPDAAAERAERSEQQ